MGEGGAGVSQTPADYSKILPAEAFGSPNSLQLALPNSPGTQGSPFQLRAVNLAGKEAEALALDQRGGGGPAAGRGGN